MKEGPKDFGLDNQPEPAGDQFNVESREATRGIDTSILPIGKKFFVKTTDSEYTFEVVATEYGRNGLKIIEGNGKLVGQSGLPLKDLPNVTVGQEFGFYDPATKGLIKTGRVEFLMAFADQPEIN